MGLRSSRGQAHSVQRLKSCQHLVTRLGWVKTDSLLTLMKKHHVNVVLLRAGQDVPQFTVHTLRATLLLPASVT